MAAVAGAGGWTLVHVLLLACFAVATPWTVLGFWNGVIGLWLLHGRANGVPALSFEFTTIARAVGEHCLDRLAALGPHRFDYALGETQALVLGRWASAAEMRAILAELPHEANSGDVYAVLS